MTDNTTILADDFPAFDEAAVRADIIDYSPDRARGNPTLAGSSTTSAGVAARVRTSGAPMAFTLDQLAPDQRDDIPQRLAQISDPDIRKRVEGELVEARVRALANAANVRRGHPDGSAHDKAVAGVLNQVEDLEAEGVWIGKELADVLRHDTQRDPVTGEHVAVPVYRHTGQHRARLQDRGRQIAATVLELMEGPGGKHQLAKAAEEDLESARVAHEQARRLAAAEKLADKMVADEEIAKLAAGLAARKRSSS